MNPEVLVQIRELTRRYGSFLALDHLNLDIHTGEVFGLLGPNGAGKTTAIKLLTTLLAPSSGDALIHGLSLTHQPREIRRIIGYVPQLLSVDATLNGYENLMVFARLYDLPRREARTRVREYIDFMGLGEAAHKPVRTYSGGMIRRLEITQSMLHRPRVLFLDEPTVGLDPLGVNLVWEHIMELKNKFGTTILFTTHIMEEADKICSRVAFLSRGRLAACDNPKALRQSLGGAEATLEAVFLHLTSESMETRNDFQETSRERSKSARLG